MKININKKILKKIYEFKIYILTGIIIGNISNILDYSYKEYQISQVTEISIEDIKNYIFSSNSLTKNEKEYLFNSDFFKDVLSTVNEDKKSIFDYQKKFQNIDIISYEKKDNKAGYYSFKHPNYLYVADYNELNSLKKDTVAHEFIHLCQNKNCILNSIIEASAEIISKEYFELNKINAYQNEVKSLKILMEIIGPQPIWNYVFKNDYKGLENSIKPYLSNKEYKEFINCLIIEQADERDRIEKSIKINKLLDTLYYNKYNKNIEEDKVISLIRSNNLTLSRYYFNYRFINKENSFYRDETNINEEDLTLEEAYQEDLVLFLNDKDIMSYEEYMNIFDDNKKYCIPLAGILKEDLLTLSIPQKIYIPTIEEKVNNKVLTLTQ